MDSNKSVDLRFYFELLLHVLIWILIASVGANIIEGHWWNIFQRFVNSQEWDQDKYWEWKARFSYNTPYLFFLIAICFKGLFFYTNIYLILPKYQNKGWKLTLILLLNTMFFCISVVSVFSIIADSNRGGHFWLEFVWLFHGTFVTTFIWYLVILTFCVLYYFVRKILIQKIKASHHQANAREDLVEVQATPFHPNKLESLGAERLEETHIVVKSGVEKHPVPLKDILYIEASGNHVFVATKEKRILTLSSLHQMQKTLPVDDFVRVHKSFIVARKHIKVIENHQVSIAGLKIPIGRTYKEEFLKYFNVTHPLIRNVSAHHAKS